MEAAIIFTLIILGLGVMQNLFGRKRAAVKKGNVYKSDLFIGCCFPCRWDNCSDYCIDDCSGFTDMNSLCQKHRDELFRKEAGYVLIKGSDPSVQKNTDLYRDGEKEENPKHYE